MPRILPVAEERLPLACPLSGPLPILAAPDLVEEQAHQQHQSDPDGGGPDRAHKLGVSADEQHGDDRKRVDQERTRHSGRARRTCGSTAEASPQQLLALLRALPALALGAPEEVGELGVAVAGGVLDVGLEPQRVVQALLDEPDDVVVLVLGAGYLAALGRHGACSLRLIWSPGTLLPLLPSGYATFRRRAAQAPAACGLPVAVPSSSLSAAGCLRSTRPPWRCGFSSLGSCGPSATPAGCSSG